MVHRFWIVSLMVLMVGCANPPSGKGTRFQVAVLKGPSAMSMIKMIRDGFSCQEKQANFSIYNEPEQVKALLIKRQAEIVLLPANMAAILYNKGVRDYALAAVPVWGSLYLAGTDTSVHSISDLRGKTVYLMARGATPDIVFRFLLKANYLNPGKDVVFDYTFNGHFELASAITAGRAPLGVISEPFVSLAANRNPEVRALIDLEKIWNQALADSIPMVQTAVMVNRDFLKNNRETVKIFFNRYREAIAWLENNRYEAGRLIADFNIVPDEKVAQRALERCNIRFEYAYDKRIQIDRYWQILFTFNPDAVGGKLPDAGFYAEVEK